MDVTIPCPCPPKADGTARHDVDTVTLPDVLDFRTTLTVRQMIRFAEAAAREAGESMSLAEMTAVMTEAYLLHGILAWTLVDDHGKALPVTKPHIRERILANYESAEKIGDAADDRYSEKVVLPLVVPASTSSQRSPTPGSTSPTNGPSPKPRKPSKRSSTSTSPMAVTGPMAASPGGVSSSSLS